MTTPETSIARVAAQQHGVFTRDQARTAGFSSRQIADRVGKGVWIRLSRRALAPAGTPPTRHLDLMAATLSFPGTVVSHLSAAWLHQMVPRLGVDLTLSRQHGSKSRPGSPRIVQTRLLPAHHVVLIESIPTTSPARTLFDLSTSLSAQSLGRLVDAELAARRLTPHQLARIDAEMAATGRPGSTAFARLVNDRQAGYVAPESELEQRFIAVCDRAGLPPATRQFVVPWHHSNHGGRVDFAWPTHRLICEVDGRRHHGLSAGFETDRLRDQYAVAAGWRTVRFTWHQVTMESEHVVAVLRSALGA